MLYDAESPHLLLLAAGERPLPPRAGGSVEENVPFQIKPGPDRHLFVVFRILVFRQFLFFVTVKLLKYIKDM